jgi:RHS repeat-associated protein
LLTNLYLYEDEGYEPLARVDGTGPLQKIRYYHNDLNGLPEQLTEADGHNVWQATYRVWGNTLEEVREPYYIEEQNLRFQGQYLDRETGLHFNTFRFYDPDVGRFTTPDPIGLNGSLNFYAYSPNPFEWIDPLGLSCRLNSVGRTSGKSSRTGKAVIARMRAEGKIIGSGKNMRFQSTDKKWYSIKDADMAHKTDAVKYWNSKGGFHGAKTKEVRGWMRDPDNYELEYYSHNRSKGALLTDRYRDSGDFIGPAEKPIY